MRSETQWEQHQRQVLVWSQRARCGNWRLVSPKGSKLSTADFTPSKLILFPVLYLVSQQILLQGTLLGPLLSKFEMIVLLCFTCPHGDSHILWCTIFRKILPYIFKHWKVILDSLHLFILLSYSTCIPSIWISRRIEPKFCFYSSPNLAYKYFSFRIYHF